MKKLLCALALSFVGWMAGSQGASAATVAINPNPFAFFGDTLAANAPLDNAYQFSFSGTATGYFAVLAGGISGLTTRICSDATCSVAPTTTGNTVGSTLASLSDAAFNLTTGTYFLVVTGTASMFSGGYFGVMTLNVTPTVPIPAALFLFATAIASLGGARFLRRKDTAAA